MALEESTRHSLKRRKPSEWTPYASARHCWPRGRRFQRVAVLCLFILVVLVYIVASSSTTITTLLSRLEQESRARVELKSWREEKAHIAATAQMEAVARLEAMSEPGAQGVQQEHDLRSQHEVHAQLESQKRPHPKALPLPNPAKFKEPFFCSTWDSATRASGTDRSELVDHYSQWIQYSLKKHPLPSKSAKPRPRATPYSDDPLLHRADKPKNMASPIEWKKPTGFRIVALVFFGRSYQVDILDCYLQQNMARHGGFLDEVHFIAHTIDPEALAWLDNLVAATPDYYRKNLSPICFRQPQLHECRYERIWEHFATDPHTLYIKIDDDINYIHPEAIPRLVYKRVEHPHPYAISVNLINSPIAAYLHYHTGAIYPYLPEPYPLPRRNNSPTWQASELPRHPEDEDYHKLEFEPSRWDALESSAIKDDDILYRTWKHAPFPGHRWLPLTQNSTSILHTPISRSNLDPFGPGIKSWAMSAQEHYSLLQNIENNTLHKYWMAPVPPLGDGLWYMQYTRYNLNFLAVWGRDIVLGAKVRREGRELVSDLEDDEKNITADIPMALGRPMVIDVQALGAHMNFHDQQQGMRMTDLLDRWRAYVNDKVCAPTRQKGVPGQVGDLGWNEINGDEGLPQCPWVPAG